MNVGSRRVVKGSQTKIRFIEVQTFRQGGVGILIALLLFVGLLIVVSSTMATGIHAGSVIGICVFAGVTFLLMSAKLTIRVTDDGLSAQYWPMHWRPVRIDLGTVVTVEAKTYRPILEYGGWGLRYRPKGKAYNVRGNRGVLLTFRGGRSLLLGSQRAKDLAQAIESVRIPH